MKIKTLKHSALSVLPSFVALSSGWLSGIVGGYLSILIILVAAIIAGILEDLTKGY